MKIKLTLDDSNGKDGLPALAMRQVTGSVTLDQEAGEICMTLQTVGGEAKTAVAVEEPAEDGRLLISSV